MTIIIPDGQLTDKPGLKTGCIISTCLQADMFGHSACLTVTCV